MSEIADPDLPEASPNGTLLDRRLDRIEQTLSLIATRLAEVERLTRELREPPS